MKDESYVCPHSDLLVCSQVEIVTGKPSYLCTPSYFPRMSGGGGEKKGRGRVEKKKEGTGCFSSFSLRSSSISTHSSEIFIFQKMSSLNRIIMVSKRLNVIAQLKSFLFLFKFFFNVKL